MSLALGGASHLGAIEIKEKVFGGNEVRVFRGGKSTGKLLALTFDDAPNPYTRELLRVLAEEEVRATFFLIGSQVERYPKVAKEIVSYGHEIGNHSYSHRIDESFSLEAILEDILKAEQVIQEVTNHIPIYFRPPRGFINGKIREACGILGYTIVMWDFDSEDWKLEEEALVEKIFNQEYFSGILLFHSVPQTVRILPQVIHELHTRGYQLVTVSTLFER